MKLIQLNVTANRGSTGKIAEGIGMAAMSRGWDSYIAYGRSMNPSPSQLIKVGRQFDVYVHYAKCRFFDSEGLGSRNPTRRLINQIKNVSPDIIHLHNIHDHWLNYPLLFEYLGSVKTPLVWTFHDCWAFTGGCYHFENKGCYKWKNEECSGGCPLNHKSAAKNYLARFKGISVIGNRLHIVAVSEWLANYVRESMFAEVGASIHVIKNGIDINGIFKPDMSNDSKYIMVLGVSNIWSESKGLNDFTKLRAMIPNDIPIVLVGLNKKQIASLPEGIIGKLRTSSGEELADLYRKASVLVNPTYNDSFPTVNLEALACGTPVITYRTGGSPEAIDEKTGIVVDKGDIGSLASSIREIIDHPERFTRDDCRKRAETCFDRDIQFNKYIELYEELLNK